MIQFTKDNTMTLTSNGGLPIPDGTIVKGAVKPYGSLTGVMDADIQWSINEFEDIIYFKEVPINFFLNMPCFNADGSQIYTFATPASNNSPIYTAIYISTQIIVAFLEAQKPEFLGKVEIINVPLS